MSEPIVENSSPVMPNSRLDALISSAVPHRRLWLWTAVALQTLVLLSMTIPRSLNRLTGERVLLKVMPVDPRDLFRGDYVILRYEFSGWWWGQSGVGTDQVEVYVPLIHDNDRHSHAGQVTLSPPGTGLFLKGKRDPTHGWGYEFGIEQFYVQEGKGKAYEAARTAGNLWAEIAVATDGTAQIVGLVVQEPPPQTETLFY